MTQLRVLVAPSGYKESLDAQQVTAAIAVGVRHACPGAYVIELPLVDGGEGTARTLARLAKGEVRTVFVTGPTGEPVEAYFAVLNETVTRVAVVELAAAAGLRLVPRGQRDILRATSRGVGELIAAALDIGVRRILITCGDSGVNDGGTGMLEALGARFLDQHGQPIATGGLGLADLHQIDLAGLDPRLRETSIEVACNLQNVLCGPDGVARVFGPQKGASPADVDQLAAALDRYARVIERDFGIDVRSIPGGGASGGVGAGLHALLGAKLRSRFEVLLPHLELDRALVGTDLVITAEGGIDATTACGKIPAEVGRRARAYGVPVVVLAGTIGRGAEIVRNHGVDAYFSTVARPETLDEAMRNAEAEIALTAENVVRVMLAGRASGMRPAATTAEPDPRELADAPVPAALPPPAIGRTRANAAPIFILTAALGLALTIPGELAASARIALFAFGAAVILWSLSAINATYVALGAVLFMVLGGAIKQNKLFEVLAADVIWLMIGVFILGEAVRRTGLADRLTRTVAIRARNVNQMLWLVTLALLPLAVFIPSTSARAVVAIPLFRSLSQAANDSKVTRSLALLIPTVILVSTTASLTGAASHLIANDLLNEVSHERISFAAWLLYGAPFGVAASFASTLVISRLFLNAEERDLPLREIPVLRPRAFTRDEMITLALIAGMAVLWILEGWHGLKVATVSVVGAFVLTLPGVGVLSWKNGVRAVPWNLVIFVGAALVLGNGVIETGAAKWLIEGVFATTHLAQVGSPLVVVLAVTMITLTSHIYLTSHTARTAALIPPLLSLAQGLGLNGATIMFIATVGMNYCLTFPVSAKGLLMFQELEDETWIPTDLLKLSAVLMPIYAALMVVFYYAWWRNVGLAL